MSGVVLSLDLQANVPPYEQVRSQLAGHVRTGTLAPGERLPTVRVLAADLGVATNTVARAYRELEQAGLVESRRRTGTVVRIHADAGAAADRERDDLREAAAALVRAARASGLDDEGLLDLVRGAALAHASSAAQR